MVCPKEKLLINQISIKIVFLTYITTEAFENDIPLVS